MLEPVNVVAVFCIYLLHVDGVHVLTLSFTVSTATVSSNTSDGLQSHGLRLAGQTRLKETKNKTKKTQLMCFELQSTQRGQRTSRAQRHIQNSKLLSLQ